MKKILAIMLAVFMLVSVFSVNVFAVDETEEDTADVQGTASTSFLGESGGPNPWERVVKPGHGWEPPSEGWLDTSVIKFQNWHFNITDLVLKAAGVKDIANIVSVKATVELVGKDSISAYRESGNPTVQLEYGKVYNPNGTAFGADAAYIEDDIIDIAVCNNFEGNKATVSGKIPAGAKVITLDLGGFGKITQEDNQEFVISVEVEFIPEEPETVVAKRNSGVIYIDEEYHGMLVNGHLLTYPHEADNALGYCPVCNAIIEANEEVEVEVVDPTEPGDVETETDEPTIDVTEPEQPTEEEKNPPMGIAFAVLPMAVAALALVSSKRR